MSGKLTFSHYCEVLDLDDDEKRGFMFVGTNQRVPVGSEKDYVDMVFYNKPLRAYVLIELKTTKLTASTAGQINEYLNYYAAEVNDEYDNPPIGIILCTDKNHVRRVRPWWPQQQHLRIDLHAELAWQRAA